MGWVLWVFSILAITACQQQTQAKFADPSATPGENKTKKTYSDIIVGFSQIGAESEWRSANTQSIKETAEELGVELRFFDAQQKQENQLTAMHSLIVQKVDVIGISPVVETGWEEVFQQAKDAGIPIIIVDRRADVPEHLYVSYMGSDFIEEGRNAARIMVRLTGGKANIIELVGTIGSAPSNDRYKGFREIIKDYPDMRIIDSQSGDFTRAKGKEVMELLLKIHKGKINAVYSHNDDMTLGAIQAIEGAGLKPAEDIKIVSVDASHGAFEAMIAGKLNATVECNPLLGPQFFELVLKVVNGESVPKWVPSKESIFFPDDAKEVLPTRKY